MDNNLSTADRGWIFHRNREQPTPDSTEPPLSQIKFYLDRYRIKEALQIFFEENTLRLLSVESDFMWDIIPLICKRLRGLCQYRFRVFEGCERMLCRIAVDVNCNPKEVLISLLAELSNQDEHDDDNIFRAMIRPLEGTLLRMNRPSPRDENFSWVLNDLVRYVKHIELPQDYNLEGKKRLALPNDPSVKSFIEVLPLMFSFIEEFNEQPMELDKSQMPILTESQIDEVLNGELVDDDSISDLNPTRGICLDASIVALMSIMYKPLAFLDLTSYCNDLRLLAHRCLNTLLKLRPNLLAPIYKRINEKSSHMDQSLQDFFKVMHNGLCPESVISFATCSYLYRCERLSTSTAEDMQSVPQVITHESMLTCHLPFIVSLLERSEILVHEKGLLLLESLLRRIAFDSLDQKFLDLTESSSLNKHLFKIMVFSPLCTNRRKAYDMFTCLCDLLTHDCKLKMFKYVLNQNDLRPCVRAACIDQYRKHLTNVYRELMILHQQMASISTGSKNLSNLCGFSDVLKIIDSSDSIGEKQVQTEISTNGESLDQNCEDLPEKNKSSDAELIANIGKKLKSLQLKYKAMGGPVLIEFLDICIGACLPDSQHTDIIENYELLLATLTMFRFLKLRKIIFKDKVEEDYLCGKRLKKVFFDPIRSAIALIMSELKLHHKDIVDGHRMKNTKITQNSIINVTQSRNEFDLLSRILGPKLDEIVQQKEGGSEFNEQDEADCLNWALCRLDLVESVLVRTCDLYNV